MSFLGCPYCCLKNRNHDTMPLVVPWICLLFQQCLDRTDPGMPLLPDSNHLPTSVPVTTYRTISAILSFWEQSTPFSELNSLLLSNHQLPISSELFHQGGDHYQLPIQPSAGLLHLPLFGLLIVTMWLKRAWVTSSASCLRSPRVLSFSWRCKPAWQLHLLPGPAEAFPR